MMLRILITFITTFTFSFSHLAMAQEFSAADFDNLDFDVLHQTMTFKQKRATQQKTNRVFNRRIRQARRKNRTLDQAILHWEMKLENAHSKMLRVKKRLSKRRVQRRITRKLRRSKSRSTFQDIQKSVNGAIDRSNLEEAKLEVTRLLRNAGSEVKFLENLKNAQVESFDKVPKNNVAGTISSTLGTALTVLVFAAIFGLSLWGIIALVAVGTVLAYVGVVFLGIFALLGGWIVISCPFWC